MALYISIAMCLLPKVDQMAEMVAVAVILFYAAINNFGHYYTLSTANTLSLKKVETAEVLYVVVNKALMKF